MPAVCGFAAQDGAATTAAQRAESLRHIDIAFLCVAVLIACLAGFIWSVRGRLLGHTAGAAEGRAPVLEALRSRWAALGAVAIFLYVGAEVSIGSSMTNFLSRTDVLGVSLEHAGKLLSFYWGGAMVGRFIGSALLTRIRASLLLAVAAGSAALLCLMVSRAPGDMAGYAALSIGFFNSIMFPVIFTLTLERTTASEAATSGLLCMAIFGGAVLPLIVGHVADTAGLRAAYAVPLIAYACLCAFGIAAGRARVPREAASQ